jgi:hypothetical protein
MRFRALLVLAALAALTAALPAAAAPQDDFNAIYADWKADGDVPSCRYTQAQLENAYNIATSNPDLQYETRFGDEVATEINRWKSAGCAGVQPFATRRVSPLHGARIVTIKGRGGARKEVLRIRNMAKKTLSFRKATLRNRKAGKRNRATFPARFRLKRGKTAIVRVGCQKGKRRASFRRTTVWLCRKRQFFADRGDLGRLADAKGVVVTQRGYGTLRRRAVF